MMIWNFAFGTCHGRGALKRFLVVLILIETRAVLIMKVSPGVNIFMRWVSNFCLFKIFPLMVLACEMSYPGGGSFVRHYFYCAHRDFVMNIRWFLFLCRNSCLGFYCSCFSALCDTC